MQFKEGTTIKTSDGEKVGEVARLVIDPVLQDVTHVIVEKGFLFKQDHVIPIELFEEITDEQLQLKAVVDELEDFPEYQEDYYVAPKGYQDMPYVDWSMEPLLYYPPVRQESFVDTDVDSPHGEERTSRNIPEGNIVVREGTKVFTLEDEHAGDVEKIFTDNQGKITHILLSKGFLFKTERLIPVGWVRQLRDDEIKLYVRSEVIEDLPDYDA